MQASTLERRIEDPNLPAPVRELLAIRLQAGRASTSKYSAAVRGASSDGRIRGTSQFCGAARTGRWAHRLVQPGNMTRPDVAAYDAGTGPDLYKLAYSKSFNVTPDSVTKPQRQIGKVQELMLQYEGGVGAYLTGALTYGIDLEEMAEGALAALPRDLREEAQGFLTWTRDQGRNTFGLSDTAFVVCDAFKRGWRRAHPAIQTYWSELADTVREAIGHPGVTLTARKLKVRRDGAWLRIGLPGGRALCYPAPEVSLDGTISYMGVNQYSRKWQRLKTYGGKLFENVCQAVARDVMAWNMPAIEAAGYQIVLTVHDEVVTEAPDSPDFNADHLGRLLAATPPWAQGMPLAAGGFEDYRYRKD